MINFNFSKTAVICVALLGLNSTVVFANESSPTVTGPEQSTSQPPLSVKRLVSSVNTGEITSDTAGRYLDSLENLSGKAWGALTNKNLDVIEQNLTSLEKSGKLTDAQNSQYHRMNAVISMGDKFAEEKAAPGDFAAYVDVLKTQTASGELPEGQIDWPSLATTLGASTVAISALPADSDAAYYLGSAQGTLVQEAVLGKMSKFTSPAELTDTFEAFSKLPADEQTNLLSVVTGKDGEGKPETFGAAMANTLVSRIAKKWSDDDAANTASVDSLLDLTKDMDPKAQLSFLDSLKSVADPSSDTAFPSGTNEKNVESFYDEYVKSYAKVLNERASESLTSLNTDVSQSPMPSKGKASLRKAYGEAYGALSLASKALKKSYDAQTADGKQLSVEQLVKLESTTSDLQEAHTSLGDIYTSIESGGTTARVKDFFKSFLSKLSLTEGSRQQKANALTAHIKDLTQEVNTFTEGTDKAPDETLNVPKGDGSVVQHVVAAPVTIEPKTDSPNDSNPEGLPVERHNNGETDNGSHDNDGNDHPVEPRDLPPME